MKKQILIAALLALALAPAAHAACPVELGKDCKATLGTVQALAEEADQGGTTVELTDPGSAVTAIRGQAPSQPVPPPPDAKEKLDAVAIERAAP